MASILTMAVFPDRNWVILGYKDSTLIAWNLETREEEFWLQGHKSDINALIIAENGSKVISGSEDKTLRVWDLSKRKVVLTVNDFEDAINNLAVIPDDHYILVGTRSELTILDLKTGHKKRILRINGFNANSLAMTLDGDCIVGGMGKNICIYDLKTEEEKQILTGHNDRVTAITLSSDGQHKISGCKDKTIKVWDLKKGKCISTFTTDSIIKACTVFPENHEIIAGDSSGKIHFPRLRGFDL